MNASTMQATSGKVAVVGSPNAKLEFKTIEFSQPKGKNVLLKIEACGVCHSDSFAMTGQFPGIKYPVIPGHEIAATVVEVGPDAKRIKKGDRVGVGWSAGHCGHCIACRSGDFVCCKEMSVPGITCDGGYGQYAMFNENGCAIIPEGLDSAEAGPLMCAGVTTFNSLRNSHAKPSDVVAILGLGGLGHLGVQFANKMGFHTVGIARGAEKADFAKKLGAHTYIDSEKQDVAAELQKLGGAKVVLATVTSTKAMTPAIGGLAIGGQLLIVGAGMEPLDFPPVALLGSRLTISGWPSGTAKDSEDCLRFAALTGIRPMIERFPFSKTAEAYERMMSGKARFRAVIDFRMDEK